MEIKISDGAMINSQTIVTGRGCVIGQSGSGKSYLVGVITEELCANGLPFVIVDTEGEYASLRQLYEVLIVGSEHNSDVSNYADLELLFEAAVKKSIPIVLDVSEVMDRQKYVQDALAALYKVEEKLRMPYLVIVEEADKLAPNIITRKSVNMVEEIAVRGRKRGIGLLIATQRPANVSKNVLSQCSFGFIGKLSIENDVKAISILFDDRQKLNEITRLAPGSFMSFGLEHDDVIKVRKRLVEHMGITPQISSMPSHSNINELVKMMKGNKATPTASTQKTTQKQKPSASVNVVQKKIDQNEAQRIITRMLKKQFGMFGKTLESIEKLELKYIDADMFNVRIPTRKTSEYIQKIAVLKGPYILEIDGKIKLKDSGIEKPIAFSSATEAVMKVLAKKHKAHLEDIARESGLSLAVVSRETRRMLDAEMVQQRNDTVVYKDNTKLFLNSAPATVSENVSSSSLLVLKKLEGVQSKSVLINMLPTAQIMEHSEIYLPIYEATLRHDDKVRILHIDAISGKPLAV